MIQIKSSRKYGLRRAIKRKNKGEPKHLDSKEIMRLNQDAKEMVDGENYAT